MARATRVVEQNIAGIGVENLDQMLKEAEAAFAAAADMNALEQAKAVFLGKSGRLTELLKGLGKLDP